MRVVPSVTADTAICKGDKFQLPNQIMSLGKEEQVLAALDNNPSINMMDGMTILLTL